MRGPYNGVAPQPVTNRDLTKAVASVLNKPLILPNVPAFALKIALGEMSAIVVNGSKVSADKIINAGYTFRYPILQDALENLLKD
jgi:NAD dependent epimerase/dehydratase family enzyme